MTARRRDPFLFPAGVTLGSANVVLHASARQHRVDDFAGPLSIKTVVRGTVTWICAGRPLTVGPGSFLVLDQGERYSMDIDEPEPVETACVFFRNGFVESAALDATTPLTASLDDPGRAAPGLPYLSRVHSDTERAIVRRVQRFAEECSRQLAPSAHEEEFALLASDLLELYAEFRELAARVPAARPGTRGEVLRRLSRAREFLHANTGQPVSLEDAARAACLSPFHFHRAFRAVHGVTPHRYLTSLRLQSARADLLAGVPVTEACFRAGFSDLSSFGRLFRSEFGCAPSRAHPNFARSA